MEASLSLPLSLLFSWPFKPFGLSPRSPTPAYYNLFQYSSLLTQMERQKSLFENIFLFLMTMSFYRLPHTSEALSVPFLHAKIVRTHLSQTLSLREGFLMSEIVLSFSFGSMLQWFHTSFITQIWPHPKVLHTILNLPLILALLYKLS